MNTMNISRVWGVLVIGAMLAPRPVAGQSTALPDSLAGAADTTETNRPPIIPFLEGTDIFWTVQSGKRLDSIFPNRLEGDIFPHLVVLQNYTDLLNIEKQTAKGDVKRLREFAYSISGTPAVRIRMLRETSAPVRTPSYMPRGNFQVLWVRGLKDCDPENPKPHCRDAAKLASVEAGPLRVLRALAALPRVSLWEAHLIVGHHSNGQDGCIVKDQIRIPTETGDCFPAGVTPTKTNINRIDGSFSTNYIRTGINYSRNWMVPGTPDKTTGATDLHAVREARAKVEIEYHPRAWVDENIVDLYGRTRLNLGGAYAARSIRVCQKRLEGSAAAVWNPGVVDSVPEWSGSVQVSCFPWNNGGWGFFARFYTGQDYYNIGFLDTITRFHVGATFNQTGFFRFRRPAPAP
jgi:hypothetical protein